MTASDVPPQHASEAPSKANTRFDWRTVFGILSIAIALVILAAGVWLLAVGFGKGARSAGEPGIVYRVCYTYFYPSGAGSWLAVLRLSSCIVPLVVGAGLGLAAFGLLSTRKQASSRVRRLSWAGLGSVTASALLYSVIFGLWFLGKLLCNYSNFTRGITAVSG
jgi:hypothetical protein